MVLALAAGTAGGVAAALMSPAREQPATRDASPAPGGGVDPLNLGTSLTTLACTGQDILVIGAGNNRAALAAPMSDFPAATYAERERSCATYFFDVDGAQPDYIAFLGPFPPGDACEARMSVAHKGDYVTRLTAGNTTAVRCLCELPTAEFPVLSTSSPPTTSNGIWIRQMQFMFLDGDRNPTGVLSGRYDAATAAMVRTFQERRALPATGVMDQNTWRELRAATCRYYDY